MAKYKTIKEARTSADLTQEELARQCGVSVMTVSRWERATMEPSATALKRISKATGVKMDELDLRPFMERESAIGGGQRRSLTRYRRLHPEEGDLTITETEDVLSKTVTIDAETLELLRGEASRQSQPKRDPIDSESMKEDLQEIADAAGVPVEKLRWSDIERVTGLKFTSEE